MQESAAVISPADDANQGAWLMPAHQGVKKWNVLTEIIYTLHSLW